MEYIFIIPYRNRESHKHFFIRQMTYLLEDYDPSTYEVVFCLQKNNLPFNRGAMKNIGFLAMRAQYPDNYRDITFIFKVYFGGVTIYRLVTNIMFSSIFMTPPFT